MTFCAQDNILIKNPSASSSSAGASCHHGPILKPPTTTTLYGQLTARQPPFSNPLITTTQLACTIHLSPFSLGQILPHRTPTHKTTQTTHTQKHVTKQSHPQHTATTCNFATLDYRHTQIHKHHDYNPQGQIKQTPTTRPFLEPQQRTISHPRLIQHNSPAMEFH